jgi:hypothetical protein
VIGLLLLAPVGMFLVVLVLERMERRLPAEQTLVGQAATDQVPAERDGVRRDIG